MRFLGGLDLGPGVWIWDLEALGLKSWGHFGTFGPFKGPKCPGPGLGSQFLIIFDQNWSKMVKNRSKVPVTGQVFWEGHIFTYLSRVKNQA